MIRSIRELRSKQKSLPYAIKFSSYTRQSETTRKGVACRSPSLGLALGALAGLESSAQDRKTRDRDCVAPQRLSALLVLEKPPAPRSPARLRRVAGADSQIECRLSRLGCTTHSWRVGQTRHQSLRDHRRQVHGATSAAALADLAYLPEQSCERSGFCRFLCGSNRYVSAAVCIRHPLSRPSSPSPLCGHQPSDRGVDGPPAGASVPLGQRSGFSGA